MELEQYIDEMSKVLRYYAELPSDFNDIERLIVAKRKLVHYSFYFSTEVGNALAIYNNSYNIRKSAYAKCVELNIKGGDSVSKAQIVAEKDVEKLRETEGNAEALYRRVKGYQDALNQSIQSIMQDISYLKQEKEYSKSEN